VATEAKVEVHETSNWDRPLKYPTCSSQGIRTCRSRPKHEGPPY